MDKIYIYIRCCISLLIFIVTVCNNFVQAQGLRDADLVFRIGASSSMGDAIASATDRGEGPVVHVGIFAIIDDQPSVIEATTETGVSITPLSKFIAESRLTKASPCIKVMRVEGIEAPQVIERALSYVGCPYDYAFMPGDEALYCSELVYECFLGPDGDHIFQSNPMNFYAPDGSLPEYWQNLFDSLGIDVPQGVQGTNPAAMSSSPRLSTVLTF